MSICLGISNQRTHVKRQCRLGPGITYPLTSYEPAGIFLVIGGSPEWKCGDEPWARVEAGSFIHRAANGAEGKRPGKEPMLALYAWF